MGIRAAADLERKERTRNRLLDAAGEVFAQKGYHFTLISDIVARAELGQGTFYRFFPSKREIFVGLFDRFISSLVREFDVFSIHTPTNHQEYLEVSRSSVREMAGILWRERDLSLLFLREARSVDRDFEARFRQVLDGFAQIAATWLEHAVSLGFARPCNAEVVSQCLVGIALRHLDLYLSSQDEPGDPDELVREIVDFAFQGFGRLPEPERDI